jgi:ParB-like chromosome segregation protein Spo0J
MSQMKNYELIKLDKLTPGEEVGLKNAREKLSDIPALADDIEARGLLNPLIVWKTKKDGEDVLVRIGGARREAAITLLIEQGRANGFGQGVPCNVIEAETLKDAMYGALADNIQRENLTSFEIAMECGRLKLMGDTQKVIAKALHKSETWVSRKLDAMEKAGPALKKAWRAGKLADDTVEDLAKTAKWVDAETDKDGKETEGYYDYEAQEASVEEALKARASGGRGGKSKARKVGKQKAGKQDRPGTKVLKAMVQIVDEAEEEVEVPEYVCGVFDALRFAQGSIPLGKLGPDWKAFVKAADEAAKEKAKIDAAAAKEWAEGGKKGKKGRKAAE